MSNNESYHQVHNQRQVEIFLFLIILVDLLSHLHETIMPEHNNLDETINGILVESQVDLIEVGIADALRHQLQTVD